MAPEINRNDYSPIPMWSFLVAMPPGIFCGYHAAHWVMNQLVGMSNETDAWIGFVFLLPLSLFPLMIAFALGYSAAHTVCIVACVGLRALYRKIAK